MRLDPFRDFDRLAEQTLSVVAGALRSLPMDALRRGDEFIVHLDVPSVGLDDLDLTIERCEQAASGRPRLRRPLLRCPNVVVGSVPAPARQAASCGGHRAGPTLIRE